MNKELNKLHIGCGKKILNGFVNMDILKLPGVDMVHDLEKTPYPFTEGRFNYILADNVLEHMSDLIKVVEELHRISANNAIIEIYVPYFSNRRAFQDPTHKRFFTLTTFDYFTENMPYNFYSKVRFQVVEKKLIFDPFYFLFSLFFNKFQNLYELFCFPYFFPAGGIKFVLKVIKRCES